MTALDLDRLEEIAGATNPVDHDVTDDPAVIEACAEGLRDACAEVRRLRAARCAGDGDGGARRPVQRSACVWRRTAMTDMNVSILMACLDDPDHEAADTTLVAYAREYGSALCAEVRRLRALLSQSLEARHTSREGALARVDALEAVVRALPVCLVCGAPAVYQTPSTWCDEHRPEWATPDDELPYAAALRALEVTRG